MLIQALDPAKACGFAIGPAGEKPNSGVIDLRKSGQHRSVGCGNIIAYLSDTWNVRKPDVLAYEAPMTIQAWLNNARKSGRYHGSDAIESAHELSGAIMGVCERFGVRFEQVYRISMMTTITGKAGWGDPKLNKQKIIQGLIAMGMLDPWVTDDDQADAVALHVAASKKFAKVAPRNFGLFSGN
jgi:hypothetical protein